MKVTVQRKHLLDALRNIKPFLGSCKGPAYARVIWLACGSDSLDVAFTSPDDVCILRSIPGQAESHSAQPFGVLYDSLANLVAASGPEISLEGRVDENCCYFLKVVLNGCAVEVNCADQLWHTAAPLIPEGETYALDALDELRAAIAAVLGSVNDDYGMDSLNCVRLKRQEAEVVVEGLNGHQYQRAVAVSGGDLASLLPERGILIRKKTIKSLLPLLCAAWLGEAAAGTLEMSGATETQPERPVFLHLYGTYGRICLPLANFDYPDTELFRQRCLNSESYIQIAAGPLQQALRVFAAIQQDSSRAVVMEPVGAGLQLTMKHAITSNLAATSGLSVLPVEFGGNVGRVAFPAFNLFRLIRGYGAEETVRLHLTGPEGPCLITGSDHPGLETIIMPMKILDDWNGGENAA